MLLHSSRFLSLWVSLLVLMIPMRVLCDEFQITSTPPGATVEIDGSIVGTTPYIQEVPGGYFHRTRTAFGARLGHPMIARLSLVGYEPVEITLTEGPVNWISIKNHSYGPYWLIKTNHFQIPLTVLELSAEEITRETKAAIVAVKGARHSGSGFFVTKTGIIATNAHLLDDEESISAMQADGEQFKLKIIYTDRKLDIALLKADGSNFPFLLLADISGVHQGETVVAIGNPGNGLPFSTKRGIVSAVGLLPAIGPGTWIQTDALINPGDSGGPLINSRGEVIGITTQKILKSDVAGIGFALSASDLEAILLRFGLIDPSLAYKTDKAKDPASANMGTVIFEQPSGGAIWIDHKPCGYIPSKLKLAIGNHLIVIKRVDRADLMQFLNVLPDSEILFSVRDP